jgi:hypothetical protein
MARKRYTAEQIIGYLRQAEVMVGRDFLYAERSASSARTVAASLQPYPSSYQSWLQATSTAGSHEGRVSIAYAPAPSFMPPQQQNCNLNHGL